MPRWVGSHVMESMPRRHSHGDKVDRAGSLGDLTIRGSWDAPEQEEIAWSCCNSGRTGTVSEPSMARTTHIQMSYVKQVMKLARHSGVLIGSAREHQSSRHSR